MNCTVFCAIFDAPLQRQKLHLRSFHAEFTPIALNRYKVCHYVSFSWGEWQPPTAHFLPGKFQMSLCRLFECVTAGGLHTFAPAASQASFRRLSWLLTLQQELHCLSHATQNTIVKDKICPRTVWSLNF